MLIIFSGKKSGEKMEKQFGEKNGKHPKYFLQDGTRALLFPTGKRGSKGGRRLDDLPHLQLYLPHLPKRSRIAETTILQNTVL